MKVFINGVERGADDGTNDPMPLATELQVGGAYRGRVDELKLYNFGVDALQAEYLYAGQACVAPPALDVNGDCVVGMDELSALAGDWLTDGFSSDFPELE